MNKKQTAVDFLVDKIVIADIKGFSLQMSKLQEWAKQARKMEKQQMKDAALGNVTKNEGLRKIFETQFEQYYSEIYGYEEI
jgi:hypothetical protein